MLLVLVVEIFWQLCMRDRICVFINQQVKIVNKFGDYPQSVGDSTQTQKAEVRKISGGQQFVVDLVILKVIIEIENSRMGQNIRAIEQVVGNLQNQQLISAQQSEMFIKDYESDSPIISEVKQFISNPHLNKFIKYYVNCRYRDKQNRLTLSTTESKASKESRKELADNLHSLAETQLKDKILDGYKKYEHTIRSSLRTLTEMIILEKYWMMNSLFVQLLRNCLRVEQFRVVQKVGNTIVIYESVTDFLQYVDSKHMLYMEYEQTLGASTKEKGERPLMLNEQGKEIEWRFSQQAQLQGKPTQKYDTLIQFSVPASQKLQNYYTVLSQPSLTPDIMGLFIRFISYHHPTSYSFPTKSPPFTQLLGQQCCFAFDIVQAGFRLQSEIIKLELSTLLNFTYSYKASSALEYIRSLNNQQSPYNLKQSSIAEINKTQAKVNKCLKCLASYTHSIRSNKLVLDFNRYSELQFCFIHSNQQLRSKLVSCWQQNRIKIIDLMGDNGVVLRTLADVAKNQQKCGIVQEKHGNMTIKIQINSKHIFDGLTIQYEKEQKDPSLSDQKFEVLREEKDLTSKIQQEIVKDLEKEDPDLKTLGWLALFVKQHMIPKMEKPEPKWLVTDIERIEGIENWDLDVLSLSEKQLISWVWNVMKTNTSFNVLMSEPKNTECFSNFISQVQYNYQLNHNPYHNFSHAVNVLHMCYILTTGDKIQQYLSNIDILGVLISGLCHDVGHSGNTNKFETSVLNERAMTYNDISPLQNYQASKTFKILKHNGNNFLGSLETPKFLRLKQNIIHNILNTDFNKHSELLAKFEQWRKLDKQEATNQYQTLTAVIVCASDYAGSCKSFKVACQWNHLLKQQFVRQLEMERKLGLSQVDMSNELSDIWHKNSLSQFQSVLPLYQQIWQFFPTNASAQKLIQNLKNNLLEWQKMRKPKQK